MANAVFLNEQQLRKLAKIIYYQEVEAIQSIQFNSEPELTKYLGDSKDCYKSVLALLDAGVEIERKYQGDDTRSPIAHDIFSYLTNASNFSLQFLNNYRLRSNYLTKIRDHYKTLIEELGKLNPKDVAEVKALAERAVLYRNAMLEYTRKYQSTLSRNFSKWLKETGLELPDLVNRYQSKLNYEGSFDNLEDVQKIEVYEEIIEASGRGRVFANKLTAALGVAGISMLLFTAGMMVWDIFSSKHVLQTATRDAVVTVASIGGAMLGEVVGAALATALIGVEASPLFILAAGIVSSIVGAYLIGEFVGWLIDLIFGSGGGAPLSTDGHRCYVALMPNGQTLACQIAHLGTSSK